MYLELQYFWRQSILAVSELDHLSDGISNGSVVVDHYRLHSLDQTTLNVTCRQKCQQFCTLLSKI